MPKYEIIIYWSDEDNAFIAEVPELPGCMADGATRQEVLSNLDQLPAKGALISISFPNWHQASGSPVRALAILP